MATVSSEVVHVLALALDAGRRSDGVGAESSFVTYDGIDQPVCVVPVNPVHLRLADPGCVWFQAFGTFRDPIP